MGRLDGRVAIVTGAAMGIGGATARRLAADGASVLIADVETDEAEDNAERIRAAGGRAIALRTDVVEDEQVKAMVERAVQEWGRLDIVVNNAFDPVPDADGSVLEVAEQAWDAGVGGLVKAIYLAGRHAVPSMRESGGGSIVNIASVHGLAMSAGASCTRRASRLSSGSVGRWRATLARTGSVSTPFAPGTSLPSGCRNGCGTTTRLGTRSSLSSTRCGGRGRRTTSRCGRLPCLGRRVVRHGPRARSRQGANDPAPGGPGRAYRALASRAPGDAAAVVGAGGGVAYGD